MRKFTLLATLIVLALGQLCSQITTYHDTLPDGTILTLVVSGNPPIEVMIDSMFGSLDFSDVSTGLLMDRTIHFVDYTRYDGILSDSNHVDYRTFLSLYASLYSAPLDTSARPLPDLPAYKATAADIATSGVVPVGALLMHYHRIKSTALADELLVLNGIQLQDVPGRPESPYLEGRIFAVTPLQTRFEQAGLTFQFPVSLYHSNSGLTLTDIEFDPGNGVGL
ncbi:MAG: hypothetical protein R3C61_13340 [Bacteroidia bacterium]